MKAHMELVEVPRALRERFGAVASYWRIYRAVIDGRVPGRDGRRWLIPEAELPRVAEVLAAKAA